MTTNMMRCVETTLVKCTYNIHDDVEQLVQHAVRIADALVAELQKKGGQDGSAT